MQSDALNQLTLMVNEILPHVPRGVGSVPPYVVAYGNDWSATDPRVRAYIDRFRERMAAAGFTSFEPATRTGPLAGTWALAVPVPNGFTAGEAEQLLDRLLWESYAVTFGVKDDGSRRRHTGAFYDLLTEWQLRHGGS